MGDVNQPSEKTRPPWAIPCSGILLSARTATSFRTALPSILDGEVVGFEGLRDLNYSHHAHCSALPRNRVDADLGAALTLRPGPASPAAVP